MILPIDAAHRCLTVRVSVRRCVISGAFSTSTEFLARSSRCMTAAQATRAYWNLRRTSWGPRLKSCRHLSSQRDLRNTCKPGPRTRRLLLADAPSDAEEDCVTSGSFYRLQTLSLSIPGTSFLSILERFSLLRRPNRCAPYRSAPRSTALRWTWLVALTAAISEIEASAPPKSGPQM